MKKKILFIAIFILGLFIFPSVSRAETRCANGANTLELCDTIIFDTDFISPSSTDYKIKEYLAYTIADLSKEPIINSRHFSLKNCNSDFTNCTLNYNNERDYSAIINYKTVSSVYDNILNKINSLENKKYELSDIDILNFYLNENPKLTNDHWENGHILGKALDYSIEFHKDLDYYDISSYIYSRKGDNNIFETYISGNLISKYRDLNLNARYGEQIVIKNIIYVPEGTENYLETAQSRIDTYYEKGDFTIEYGGTVNEDLYYEKNNFYDDMSNSELYDNNDKLLEAIEYERENWFDGTTDGNYYKITINNRDYFFLIYENTEKAYREPLYSSGRRKVISSLNGIELTLYNPLTTNNVYNNSFVISKSDFSSNNVDIYNNTYGLNKSSINYIDIYGDLDTLFPSDYYLYDISLKGNNIDENYIGSYEIKVPIPDALVGKYIRIYDLEDPTRDVEYTKKDGFVSFSGGTSKSLFVIKEVDGIGGSINTIAFFSNPPYNFVSEEMVHQQTWSSIKKKLKKNTFDFGNYTFAYWSTSRNGTGTKYLDEQIVDTDIMNLYAIWKPKKYKISYDCGLGSSGQAPNSIIATFGTHVYLAKNYGTCSKTNSRFVSWNTAEDGTGINYNLGASYFPINDVTMYAIWEETPTNRITYHSNYPTNVTEEKTKIQDVNTDVDSNLESNTFDYCSYFFESCYYVFDHWSTNPDGTGTIYNDESVINISEDIDLYAQWIIPEHTITFHSNYGEDTTTTQVLTDGVFTKLTKNTYTRNGYLFKGWYWEPVFEEPEVIPGKPEIKPYDDEQEIFIWQNIDLYAIWEEIDTSISIIPGSIDFGDYDPNFNGYVLKDISIVNSGNVSVALRINNPTESGPFASIGFLNGKVLAPGEIYEVPFALNPNGLYHDTPGTYNGTYVITSTYVDDVSIKNTANVEATVKINKFPQSIKYTTHVQDIGWQTPVSDGAMAGTSGKSYRLEGIKIAIANKEYDGDIEYRTHVQDIGWQNYVKNGEMAGTSGKSYRLEAIQIRLTGEMAEHYDVYYRVHAQDFGWMAWAKNDEMAGTAGYAYRLEGIEIVLVPKGENPPARSNQNYNKPFKDKNADPENTLVKYRTHVQDIGWQNYVYDGAMAGTSGRSFRLEGINIALTNKQYSGDIEYRTHVQNIGWQNYVKNGAMAGTSGLSYRLEAIQIRLTGKMAEHYDVYYRVHAQDFGWMGWAKNDEMAGTAGYAFRLEGIEVVLVEKGGNPPARSNQNYNNAFAEK